MREDIKIPRSGDRDNRNEGDTFAQEGLAETAEFSTLEEGHRHQEGASTVPQEELARMRETLRKFFAEVADTAKSGDVGGRLEEIASAAFIAGMRLDEVPES